MSESYHAVGEITTANHRKRLAGQRLILGLEGPSPSDEERALIREIRPAGFILFARNVEDPAQVRALNRELAQLVPTGSPALLAVDQEGGSVQRVREPATVWPSMRAVGRAQDLTPLVATAMAIELRALGFNLNFAPCADVDSNPDNPVIGDRSFGRDPEKVAQHVASFVRAHQAQGVVACAKHFPGHGDTRTDSHVDLPVVERDAAALEAMELVPFRAAIMAGVASVMTAHVMYPAWDEELPGTLSPAITRDILRTDLGFEGVVFSDDLNMKAIADRWSVRDQVQRATEATVDVFLACRGTERQAEVFRALVQVQERVGEMAIRASEGAVERVNILRQRLSTRPQPPLSVLASERHVDLAQRIRERGVA